MTDHTTKNRRAITDSAGFWIVVFCGFGLAMLFLTHETISKKLEENANRAVGIAGKNSPETAKSTSTEQVSSRSKMIFLYFILFVGICVGAFFLVRDRLNRSDNYEEFGNKRTGQRVGSNGG